MGGARLNSGTVPDPKAMRRLLPGDAKSWTTLPGHGVTTVPGWPRDIEHANSVEMSIWDSLWRTQPQAHIWAAIKMEMIVATYVRAIIRASSRTASVSEVTACRQMADLLLLTPAALRGNRYIIDIGGVAKTATVTAVRSTSPVVGMPGSRAGSGVLSRLAPVPDVPDDDEDDD